MYWECIYRFFYAKNDKFEPITSKKQAKLSGIYSKLERTKNEEYIKIQWRYTINFSVKG